MSKDFFTSLQKLFSPPTSSAFSLYSSDEFLSQKADTLSEQRKELLATIFDREQFKIFCQRQEIETAAYIADDDFSKLSAWAVARNKFPIALKTCQNSSYSSGIFKLQAFRELPDFFERISTNFPGKLLIEEWVTAQAIIEVTCINGQKVMCTQTGLRKSLAPKPAWRMFPIGLPQAINTNINNTIIKFEKLLSIKDFPIRFSFAITPKGPALISINSSHNRPEYYQYWLEDICDNDIFSGKPIKPTQKNYLRFQYYFDDEFRLPQELPVSYKLQTLKKYVASSEAGIALLVHENPKLLLEEAKKLTMLMKKDFSRSELEES
jgi:hypothetical protein